MRDTYKKVMDSIKDLDFLPTQKEFTKKFPRVANDIKSQGLEYNKILIEVGYDPYKAGLKNYDYLLEDEMYDFIKLSIQEFIDKYSYIPNEQIYKILPLPSLKYLKIKYNITYPTLLKKIGCDKLYGYKIYRHVPNDVLLKRVKQRVDEYVFANKKLPNKKAFNQLKIGNVNFYEERFQKEYYELLGSMGYSLSMKHKPLIYKDYSPEEIFDLTKNEIQDYIDSNGTVPTQYQYRKFNAPSEIYFKRKFNLTYNELLLKLGFQPINSGEKYKYMNDSQVFCKLKYEIDNFADDKDKLPSSEEFLLLDVPSLGYIKKRYGYTYKQLIAHLGYTEIGFIKGYYNLCDKEIFNRIESAIHVFREKNGKLPTQKQYDTLDVPSAYQIKKIYDLTYKKLLDKVGFKK